jgi:hypothetical protein
MSELAFDKEGNPFRFSRRTKKLRPRRWKNAGQRGTCAAVLDPDGEQLLVDVDAEYVEFRAAVGNVPGFYRLDQCDEDGTPIEDAPPAYVTIESTRNAPPSGDADPRDAIIRDLAQINADVVRTITERFGNVMQAAADILRAADGAGLPRRELPPPLPAPKENDEDDKDDEDDEDDEDEDNEDNTPKSKAWEAMWPVIEPMIPAIGAWLASMAAKRFSPATPAVTPPPEPAPAPAAPPPAAEPSATPAPGDVTAGPSASEPAPEPVAAAAPPSAHGPAPVASPAPAAAPAQASSTTAASSAPPTAASSESPTLGVASPSPTAVVGVAPAGAAQTDGPRNASPIVEPTLEQWAHLLAIQSRLSPREGAIAKAAIARMTPEMRAQWLAELSALSIDQAADVVRSMIPQLPSKAPPPRSRPRIDGKDGEG